MPNWTITYNKIMANEGGYNRPYGPQKCGLGSGETYRGIDRLCNPTWLGWPIIDAHKKQYGVPREEAIINNAALNQQVSNWLWAYINALVNYNSISNQDVANNVSDFLLHKKYDAIKVINTTAIVLGARNVSNYSLTPAVVAIMNQYPASFYNLYRNNRIAYYKNPRTFANTTSPAFSRPLVDSFLRRVNKFPVNIQTGSSNNIFSSIKKWLGI
jgi:hypothetical protein